MKAIATSPKPNCISQLFSAVSAPIVLDCTPIIERYEGLPVAEIARRLEDERELVTCLQLPTQLGVSDDWVRLFGFPVDDQAPDDQAPDLVVRRFGAIPIEGPRWSMASPTTPRSSTSTSQT
jgi:hypothetical protein